VPERRTRYFTVEDFKEVRQTYPRNKNLPPLTLLSDIELNKPTEQEINNNVRIIENTLLEFDIDVEVVDVKVGPTVTQYAVQPFREVTNDQGEVVMQRVRVNKIASLSSDLALALSAKRLRIQPYVPGHQYMGIEVPNHVPSTVALRPVMESEAFAKAYIRRDPPVDRGDNGFRQIGIHHGGGIVARNEQHTRAPEAGYARPQNGRTNALQRLAPPAWPCRNRYGADHWRLALGHPRNGSPLQATRSRSCPQH
jgi:hypothetical protein